jgi:hypothetical protein
MALQTDFSAIQSSIEIPSDRLPAEHPRCLCRFEDGVVFAYAERGHEFVRARDHELWAVEREDVLVSARSGVVLARRRGRVFFAAETDAPLYYERAI